MRKGSSKKKTEEERPANQQATEQAQPQEQYTDTPADGKNQSAVALGRLGGKKGGPARAAKLTKEQRSEIAKKAAAARWKKGG